jgi:nucleoside-diphosphate-sugar epimerase
VTGGRGFIGQHLIKRLYGDGASVRLLTRDAAATSRLFPDAEIVPGDLLDVDALRRLARDGDVLVNLAYPSDSSETDAERSAALLAESAVAERVARMVHVSTAVVVGATNEDVITERTEPRPRSPYEKRKLRIEQALQERLRGRMPLVILRPTAVFGEGGQNLIKLASDLQREPYLVRAARRALLRSRRLNLVCVENVVAAIIFAASAGNGVVDDCFIVSDGDDPQNNYGDVTAFLAQRLSVSLPSVPDLTPAVALLLRLRGRSISNPRSIFSAQKLLSRGFHRAISFREGLERFADWYRGTQRGTAV